jgi:hypothetical protein
LVLFCVEVPIKYGHFSRCSRSASVDAPQQ